MISDFNMMEIHVGTLFTHNKNGFLQHVNEPDGDLAPRFFLGRTKDGHIWRFRHDLHDDIVEKLNKLTLAEPVPSNYPDPLINLDAFRNILEADAEIEADWSGPAYRFPEKIEAPTNILRITRKNAELLRFGFPDTIPSLESLQTCMGSVENGKVISICSSVRISPQAQEAGVFTLEGFRRRGYAADVVAGWAVAVSNEGHLPLYSTSWDNVASLALANKLGLILYGVDLHFR